MVSARETLKRACRNRETISNSMRKSLLSTDESSGREWCLSSDYLLADPFKNQSRNDMAPVSCKLTCFSFNFSLISFCLSFSFRLFYHNLFPSPSISLTINYLNYLSFFISPSLSFVYSPFSHLFSHLCPFLISCLFIFIYIE